MEYMPWGPPDDAKKAEIDWILKNTGYKEPSLAIVEPNGESKVLNFILRQDPVV